MSDDFAICNSCSAENTLINIQVTHPQAFTKKENDLVESFLFCLACCTVQKITETKHRHIDYGSDKSE